MKKYLCLLLALLLILAPAGCSSRSPESDGTSAESTPAASAPQESDAEPSTASGAAPVSAPTSQTADDPAEEATETAGSTSVLIAYFSWAENTELDGEVDAVASPSVNDPGNVQQLAGWIQAETGGDLFSIQVTDPYPSDWNACLERANAEHGEDARPALVEAQVENLAQYDTVFLGYPNWWYGVPMALLSFLEENDLAGKDVYLFCSHGTGGLARSVEIITEAVPGARISDNIFDCYEEDAPGAQADIQAWVAELGLTAATTETEETTMEARQIAVRCGELEAVYALNDSPAADALWAQLPLTLDVEDFSTNEKVFYPPNELDTADTPLAEGGAGTLAYYAPWGDVVLFYDSFSRNAGLYELGEIVSGTEHIAQMRGSITVEALE